MWPDVVVAVASARRPAGVCASDPGRDEAEGLPGRRARADGEDLAERVVDPPLGQAAGAIGDPAHAVEVIAVQILRVGAVGHRKSPSAVTGLRLQAGEARAEGRTRGFLRGKMWAGTETPTELRPKTRSLRRIGGSP